ncbi:hypothetical protein ACN8ZM_33125 [Burkholderia aenigmatica]|uniref:hypothetical protein n=1 Tax=Burkholderia aenigmatica TaxID=2015348 RepID=UPI003B43C9CA
MANKKDPNGVIATIERLTGQVPCPDGQRNALTKYLREGALFESDRNAPEKRQGKLERAKTDTLVMNLLNLDEIFVGSTQAVRKIVLGEFSDAELTTLLESAADNLRRRRDAYDYWARRMDALGTLLVDEKPDLRTVRIADALRSVPEPIESRGASPFALHAVQRLEHLEERGRLGSPSANDLTEQADAYFALGDHLTANEKATRAVEVDPKQSRAWFIRVLVLLHQRKAAIRLMQRHEINAMELAEPMSAHETMEHDLAEDAGSRAYEIQVALNEVVPRALLNWPKMEDGSLSYEHVEQLSIIRNLFVDAVFSKVARLYGTLLDSVPATVVTSSSRRRPCDYWRKEELDSGEAPVLTTFERQALALLLDERRRHAGRYTEMHTSMDTAREFRLLHLSWALRLDGYKAQWENLRQRFVFWKSVDFRQHILSDNTLIRLWQFHAVNIHGLSGVLDSLDQWHAKSLAERKTRSDSLALQTLAYLFHDCLVRGELAQCADIALHAQSLTDESTGISGYGKVRMSSPDDDSTEMPIGCKRYWKYLEALAVVLMPPTQFTDRALSVLLEAERWMADFRDTNHCFWIWEDYEFPGECESVPYEVDLRDTEPWLRAARRYISAFEERDCMKHLREVIRRLEIAERPFAPLERTVFDPGTP